MRRIKFLLGAMALAAIIIAGCKNNDALVNSHEQEGEAGGIAKDFGGSPTF